MLKQNDRMMTVGELASRLWEETPTQTAANKVRGAIYRFRRSYEGLADEYMTISEGTGYGLNPFYQITTDTDLFEKYWIQANELHSRTDRINLLKKAFELYRGPLFQTAVGATWMMEEYYRLAKMYTQVVNVLLKDLFEMKDYSGVCDYATRSFRIDPHNNHAHFWLILSFIKNKNNKLAKDAFQNAGNIISSGTFLCCQARKAVRHERRICVITRVC